MENVKKILSEHYVNPEESSLIHSKIREKGRFKIIDKISVKLDSKKDIYWAQLQNSNINNGNIRDGLVKEHEKMLMGGIWAIIDVEYDPDIRIGQNIYPFVVTNIKPIQLSTFDNSKIIQKRNEFSRDEWLNVLLRSCGYEPDAEGMTTRVKMLLLARLLPMVESNFNFVELGPRSTGKSFVLKSLHLMPCLYQVVKEQLPSSLFTVLLAKLVPLVNGMRYVSMRQRTRSSKKRMLFL